METVAQLQTRFPYMFEGQNIGLAFYKGWFDIFVRACEQIDAVLGPDKRKFHWVQIKQKYGSARFYYQLGRSKRLVVFVLDEEEGLATMKTATRSGDEIARRIDEIVDKAEKLTLTACIVCGASATTQAFGGWLYTLCSDHSPPTDNEGRFMKALASILKGAHVP